MSKGAITLTIVFEGMNLNRDEGVGKNVLTLKKIHRNEVRFIYVSDKAMKYSIREALFDNFGWDREIPLVTEEVIQYDLENANIITHPELDLFGYMYTTDLFTLTRTGPVGVTPAVALEPYKDDISFNANQGLVRRARLQGKVAEPDIRYQEDNQSLFKYSILIDLDEVGKDIWFIPLKRGDKKIEFKINNKKFENTFKIEKNENIVLIFKKDNTEEQLKLPKSEQDAEIKDNKLEFEVEGGKITILKQDDWVQVLFEVEESKKAERVEQFLKAIAWLGRKIGGNPSDLKPLLVIGGWIKVKSPICHTLIHVVGQQVDPSGLEKALDYIKKKRYIENNNEIYVNSYEPSHPYFKTCTSEFKHEWKKNPPKDLEDFAEKIKAILTLKDTKSKNESPKS